MKSSRSFVRELVHHFIRSCTLISRRRWREEYLSLSYCYCRTRKRYMKYPFIQQCLEVFLISCRETWWVETLCKTLQEEQETWPEKTRLSFDSIPFSSCSVRMTVYPSFSNPCPASRLTEKNFSSTSGSLFLTVKRETVSVKQKLPVHVSENKTSCLKCLTHQIFLLCLWHREETESKWNASRNVRRLRSKRDLRSVSALLFEWLSLSCVLPSSCSRIQSTGKWFCPSRHWDNCQGKKKSVVSLVCHWILERDLRCKFWTITRRTPSVLFWIFLQRELQMNSCFDTRSVSLVLNPQGRVHHWCLRTRWGFPSSQRKTKRHFGMNAIAIASLGRRFEFDSVLVFIRSRIVIILSSAEQKFRSSSAGNV